MEYRVIPSSQLRRRVNTIPLPKHVKSDVLSLYERWVQANGHAWAVSRFKELKTFLLGVYSGMDAKATKPSWFSTTPYGNLKGIYGDLLQRSLSSEKQFRACITLLNVYTSVSYGKVPKAAVEEAVAEITQPEVESPRWLLEHFSSSVFKTTVKGLGKSAGSMNLRQMRSRKGVPPVYLRAPLPMTVVPPAGRQNELAGRDVLDIQDSALIEIPELKALIDEAIGLTTNPRNPMTSCSTDVVGNLWFKGEPGLKVRFFAAPNLVLQRVLEPLKAELLRIASSLPWDCTHNQSKADNTISASLKAGRKLYSVDLKKATENFPWRPQRILLRRLMLGSYNRGVLSGGRAREKRDAILHLLDYAHPWKIITALPTLLGRQLNRNELVYFCMCYVVETGLWNVEGNPDNQISWSKGQPLGTGPSFPLFTMTHGMLLWFLNHSTWDSDFFVLGDDVIITDARLFQRYTKLLSKLGVPTSPAKSYSSDRLAQFAGKTFTPKGTYWFSPWREIRRENKLDLAAYWYPGLVVDDDADLVNWVLALPEPWGIGRNPEGLSLDARLTDKLVEGLLSREDKPLAATGVASLHKLWYGSPDWMKYSLLVSYRANAWKPESSRLRMPMALLLLMEGTAIPGAPMLAKARMDP